MTSRQWEVFSWTALAAYVLLLPALLLLLAAAGICAAVGGAMSWVGGKIMRLETAYRGGRKLARVARGLEAERAKGGGDGDAS